jgi:hypothetical protein
VGRLFLLSAFRSLLFAFRGMFQTSEFFGCWIRAARFFFGLMQPGGLDPVIVRCSLFVG